MLGHCEGPQTPSGALSGMSVPSHSLAESALGVGPAGTQAAMGPLPASLFSWFPSAVCAHCQMPTWWGSTLKASTLSLSPPVCAALGSPCCNNGGQQSAQWRVTAKHSARPPQCHGPLCSQAGADLSHPPSCPSLVLFGAVVWG